MAQYDFKPECLEIINAQRTEFISLLLRQTSSLVDLGIMKPGSVNESDQYFWDIFTNNHIEIRANEKLTRHFILRKKEKLSKELQHPLYLSEIYSDLSEHTKNEYWKFVHGMFLLFESAHNNRSDAIINTLTDELEKAIKKDELLTEQNQIKPITRKKRISKREKNEEDISSYLNMDKINEIMTGFGINLDDPDAMNPSNLMTMMSKMIGQTSEENNPLKELGVKDDGDMSGLINELIPGAKSAKNDSLMESILSDITSSMSNLESADEVFDITSKIGLKYQDMVASGEADSTEIIGSLMGLMTDKKFTEQLNKIDLSKIKPEDMITKMISNVSPEMMNQLTGGTGEGLDLGNIGSLVSSVVGFSGGASQPSTIEQVPEPELTPEQLKELEEYYSNIQIDESQPEVD